MKNDKTIQKISEESCTGCAACYNKCPADAISMEYNKEGFLFPHIDKNACIQCGICLSVCPVEFPIKLNQTPITYAVRAEDSIRMNSSSGGMFTILSDYVLEHGGIVYGAAFSDDFTEVNHIRIDKKNVFYKLRGSKYLQSNINNTYRDAEKNLKDGRHVLFSGTPCQIAGLYRFLKNDYKNLLTVDIICHGVPSPKVYQAYLHDKCQGKTLKKVDFREKAYWGWGTASSLFFNDGTTYRNDCYKDFFLRGFLGGLITRKCCLTCHYTSTKRVGDFTLGDFWGCGKIDKSLDDKKGTSLVFLNTDKAIGLFEVLKKHCKYNFINIDTVINIAQNYNGRLIKPTKEHAQRKVFFELFQQKTFTESFRRSVKSYDIGYVGWWDSTNYGSALTCFAMNRTLQAMGKSVLMLEHPGISVSSIENKTFGLEFAEHFYECSDITKEKDASRFNDQCETFVVGSDQLWAGWNHHKESSRFFFLNFANNHRRKIAYATSFGSDHSSYPEWNRFAAGYYMSRFDAISVREKSAVEICKNDFSVDATLVMDPVFLCPLAAYDEVISISSVNESTPFIFAYLLDPTPDKIAAVRFVSKQKNINYRLIIDGQGNQDEAHKLLNNDPNLIIYPRIEDWLAYIQKSSFVISDSFHAFCFSMIFKKDMIAYINKKRGKTRFDSIADISGLAHRLVSSSQEIKENSLCTSPIDHDLVAYRLSEQIKKSKQWLENALDIKVSGPHVEELLRWKVISLEKKVKQLEDKLSSILNNL